MIELYSSNHLVLEQGHRVSLDITGIRDEVRACCLAVGLSEPWIAEQMEMALEDFFMARAEHGDEVIAARAEIDELVARLLLAAGYRDVAAEYSRRRQVQVFSVADSAPWDAVRIRRLLDRSHALPEAAIDLLSRQVLIKLELLGLRQVSDRLISELAGHLVGLHAPGGPPIPGLLPPDSPWLLAADFWQDTVSGPARRLCEARILLPRPISRLLPTPVIVLDLARLVAVKKDGPLTEIEFWSDLQLVTQAAHQVLQLMDSLLVRVQPDAAEAKPRVLVAGFSALVAAWNQPVRKPQQAALMHDLKTRIRRDLELAGTPDALVYLQRPA